MILGAVLAGGLSTRFGSDKALAELDGQTLLARAVAQLQRQCEAVVVVGRAVGPAPCIADHPAPGMGPLGGIAGALAHALDNGFDAVLSVGVDSLGLPDDLREVLSPAPAYLAAQPVVGLWPARCLGTLDVLLHSTARHSMRAFAELVGARAIETATIPANINTLADFAALQSKPGEYRHGL
ncbi:molybdenum cofactor guanylyltransferase [Novosphingobium sp. FKTRR1]|uniref:molybdenum cofactor guanylyltransferase n=1 Tax=unclassified Novosphingobium TaxID=2644732 RepID=UPI001CF0AF65|nr:molybdenum cofactor guanylyltransferase [Novosphingobium sp. FKTRR1]